ncbi:MAG: HNH endonuclease [Actinobacteria bacterium]|nr:HNH endonuclease [Actinomycetota bacterium]
MRANKAEIARFKKHIAIEDECWVWQGCRDHHGYGQFKFRGKKVRAHRWIYEALHGELPEGLFVDHLCRNRGCVRPAHLECTTPLENTVRGVAYR